jgi:hypothetical protein
MTQWGVTLRSEATNGLLLSIEEVKRPSSNSTQKEKRRRFLASLEMTINGGGISPLLQLHPEKILCLKRKSGDFSLRSK